MSRRIHPAAVALAACLTCAGANAAFAQSEPTVLWIPLVDPAATVERDVVEGILGDVLREADDAVHIVGLQGIRSYVDANGFELPGCLQGTEPCASPLHSVVSAFDASLLIYVVALGDGSTLQVTLVDGALQQSTQVDITGADLRAAIYTTVADLIGSTARLYVTASPTPASVYIGETLVGQTPYDTTLTIGPYDVSVELEGYFTHEATLELRAGDEVRVDAQLVQRFATVEINSGTPGAQVYVDDLPEPRAINAPFRVDPGQRRIEVRAPGYDTMAYDLEIEPGATFTESVILDLSFEEFQRRRRQDVLDHPFLVEGALHFGGGSAAVSGNFDDREITCVLDIDDGCTRAGTRTIGLEAGLLVNGGYLDVRLFGVGVRRVGVGNDVALGVEGERDVALLNPATQLSVRLAQPGARVLIGRYVEPYIHTGPAIGWRAYSATYESESLSMSRATLLWELDAGVRFHPNSLVYAFLGAGTQADLLGNGMAGASRVQLGVGLNLSDPTGLSATFARWFERSEAEEPELTDTGGEL